MRISDWSSDVCSSDLAYRLEHSLGTGSAAATYTVTDGDGDTATAPIAFTIVDANVPTAGATQASVDDDALAGGNPASMTGDLPDPDSDGDNDQATFSEIGRAHV